MPSLITPPGLPMVSTPPFKVLIIGASYAGLSTALNLLDLCAGLPPRSGPAPPVPSLQIPHIEITLLDERDGFYHVIGSPLALADETYAAKAWVKYDDVAALRSPAVRHLHGSVTGVDMERKVARFVPARAGGGEAVEVGYDYLVAASGLRRVWPVVPQARRRKEYLFEVEEHVGAVGEGGGGVVVVGGGEFLSLGAGVWGVADNGDRGGWD